VLVTDAEDLLGREAERFLPTRLPEGTVPASGGGHPIAYVVIVQLPQSGEGWLAHLAERRPGFLAPAHLLDGEPGALSTPGPLAGPDPLTVVTHPTFADQRDGESVAMLGKIVAEAALDAGRALVWGRLLDPG
jgi:hypothetical protein